VIALGSSDPAATTISRSSERISAAISGKPASRSGSEALTGRGHQARVGSHRVIDAAEEQPAVAFLFVLRSIGDRSDRHRAVRTALKQLARKASRQVEILTLEREHEVVIGAENVWRLRARENALFQRPGRFSLDLEFSSDFAKEIIEAVGQPQTHAPIEGFPTIGARFEIHSKGRRNRRIRFS
jgi:hypothetical protein